VADTRVMEDAYQIVCEMLDSRLVDAVVIDSLSSLTPTEEDDKAMDEWQMGLGARLTGKFMRKSSVAQRRSLTEPDRPCLGIIISQWREKIGVMYGDNRVSPNGRAKEFFFMVRVEVRRDEWLGTDKHRVGQTFKARVIKNKTAPPQRGALVDFYWEDYGTHKAGTYDTGKQLANIGMDVGVVELAGSYYKFGGKQWQGKEKFWAAVDAEELLQHQLAREIRMIALPGIAIDIPAAPKQAKRALKRA
jgi:recombination protein RecA